MPLKDLLWMLQWVTTCDLILSTQHFMTSFCTETYSEGGRNTRYMYGEARIYQISLAQPNCSIASGNQCYKAVSISSTSTPTLIHLQLTKNSIAPRRRRPRNEIEDECIQKSRQQPILWMKMCVEDDNLKAQPASAWDCWEWQEPREVQRAKPVEKPVVWMTEISLLNPQLPPASVCLHNW